MTGAGAWYRFTVIERPRCRSPLSFRTPFLSLLPAAIAFMILSSLHAASVHALTPSDIMRKVGPAVVWIKSSRNGIDFTSQGSGCNIDSRGMIITNHHVVQGARAITVQFPSGEQYRAVAMLHEDEEKDIAIFRINGFGLPVAELGSSSNIEVGAPVVAIGTPRGLENTISTGILSGRRVFNGTSLLQITAPISEGSSGGPLFDDSGCIVGITTALIEQSQNLNFCVPINYARAALPYLTERPLAASAPLPEPSGSRTASSRRKNSMGDDDPDAATVSDEFVQQPGETIEDATDRFVRLARKWDLDCNALDDKTNEFVIRRPGCNLVSRFSLSDEGGLDRLIIRIQVRKKPEYAYAGSMESEVSALNAGYNMGRFWEDENRIYLGTYFPFVDRLRRSEFEAFIAWYETAWIALAGLEPDLFALLQ